MVPVSTRSYILRPEGRLEQLNPWAFLHGKGCTAPCKAMAPPSPVRALLQASRLEEWLSDVVRVAYVPKLNGMDSLPSLLGHVECLNSGLLNPLPLAIILLLVFFF